jgi:hypothetical protein
MSIVSFILKRLNRQGDQHIGYLRRWYLIPKNRYFNIYLHNILRSDQDHELHDHPWHSLSFLLQGEMREWHANGVKNIHRFLPVFRRARFAHRLERVQGDIWTIFITGPKIREWGFHTFAGWVHWKTFLKIDQQQQSDEHA